MTKFIMKWNLLILIRDIDSIETPYVYDSSCFDEAVEGIQYEAGEF